MKRIKICVLSVLLLIVVSAASFYCGGHVGFYQGYFYCDSLQNITNSALTSEVLRRIQDKKIDRAMNLLESALDSQIAGFGYKKENFPSFYGLRFYDKAELLDEASTGLMKRACKYRKDHPYKKDKRIEMVLNYFLSNEN